MGEIVRLDNVRKSFGRRDALDGLDRSVQQGKVVGLLGLNGSGKTTTMRIVAGLVRPDTGRARVFGADPWGFTAAERKRIGYLTERDYPFPEQTLDEAIALVDALHGGIDRDYVERLKELLGVRGDIHYTAFSRGNQRRFHLIVTLAHQPELLLLDDPAQGLDVAVRHDLVQGLLPLLERGKTTVLFSSHAFNDVERLAEEVVIVHQGRVVLHSALDELKERARQVLVPSGTVLDCGRVVRRHAGERDERCTLVDVDPERLAELKRVGSVLDDRGMTLEELFLEFVQRRREARAS